jgi:hypothetical protein
MLGAFWWSWCGEVVRGRWCWVERRKLVVMTRVCGLGDVWAVVLCLVWLTLRAKVGIYIWRCCFFGRLRPLLRGIHASGIKLSAVRREASDRIHFQGRSRSVVVKKGPFSDRVLMKLWGMTSAVIRRLSKVVRRGEAERV